MANITDASAIQFCNEEIRPLADVMISFYRTYQVVSSNWTAKGMAALIPNDGTAIVIDGAPGDGRSQINGANVNILLSNAAALFAQFTANTNLVFNQTELMAVNGQSFVPH